MSALMQTYARLPVTFSHGEGVYLYAEDGRRYLDGLAGIGVNNLGHAHPAVTAAIAEQAARLVHTSNLYGIAEQERFASSLCAVSGMQNVFFGNSGAEANEAAIKIARLYGHQRNVEKPAIVVLEDAFHGRTLATLSATGNRKIQAGFEPLVAGFTRAPRNDLAALEQIASSNSSVVAVLMETIQGEGGVNILEQDYLQAVRDLCDRQQWLFMLDEVQTGNGRTGAHFSYQRLGFEPDVVTTAKGLGNGFPIGACLARGAAAEVLGGGQHGSTYGGNPLACAAAQAVLDTLSSENIPARAEQLGVRLRDQLASELAGCEQLVDIRGRGLMTGIELSDDCTALVEAALKAGLLINVAAGNTIRLLPPLIIDEAQLDELAAGVAQLIRTAA